RSTGNPPYCDAPLWPGQRDCFPVRFPGIRRRKLYQRHHVDDRGREKHRLRRLIPAAALVGRTTLAEAVLGAYYRRQRAFRRRVGAVRVKTGTGPRWLSVLIVMLLSLGTALDAFAQGAMATGEGGAAGAPTTRQSAAQLQQLVAPIALYPDPLVAQI